MPIKHDRRGDESREEVAHKVAWAAVKKKYSKGGDGDWHALLARSCGSEASGGS